MREWEGQREPVSSRPHPVIASRFRPLILLFPCFLFRLDPVKWKVLPFNSLVSAWVNPSAKPIWVLQLCCSLFEVMVHNVVLVLFWVWSLRSSVTGWAELWSTKVIMFSFCVPLWFKVRVWKVQQVVQATFSLFSCFEKSLTRREALLIKGCFCSPFSCVSVLYFFVLDRK